MYKKRALVKMLFSSLAISLASIAFCFGGEVIELNKKVDFDALKSEKKFVVVDFFTDGCFPCKKLAPVFKEIAKEFSQITFVKVNAGKENDISGDFDIRSVPTLIFFRDGEEVKPRVLGYKSKGPLVDIIKKKFNL